MTATPEIGGGLLRMFIGYAATKVFETLVPSVSLPVGTGQQTCEPTCGGTCQTMCHQETCFDARSCHTECFTYGKCPM